MVDFFFFKQKTAYEIRKGDWSSDVCSSDLVGAGEAGALEGLVARVRHREDRGLEHLAPRHLDEVGMVGEQGGIGRVRGAAPGPVQELRQRAVGFHVARQNTAR